MGVCVNYARAQLSGEDWEQEEVLSLMEYLSELALKWYLWHVLHVNRTQEYWAFEDVILGLYTQFVQPSTMQDARDAFCKLSYMVEEGVQGFYETLLDEAQNMAVFPDEFTMWEQFLKEIPYEMLMALIIDEGLLLEVNTVLEFVADAWAYKNSVKTAVHYVGHSHHCAMKSGIVAHTQADDAVIWLYV